MSLSTPDSTVLSIPPLPPVAQLRSLVIHRGALVASARGVSVPVLVKHFTDGDPSDEQILRLRYEFMAFQKLAQNIRPSTGTSTGIESGTAIHSLLKSRYRDSPSLLSSHTPSQLPPPALVPAIIDPASLPPGFPLSLLSDADVGLALLYPDIGGTTLDKLQFAYLDELCRNAAISTSTAGFRPTRLSTYPGRQTLSLLGLIECSLTVTRHLQSMHNLGIINAALRPATILYRSATGDLEDSDRGRHQCLFLDCSQSSLFDREWADFHDVSQRMAKPPTEVDSISPECWPYIAPEQTGRMNRTVDQRTDFYSLGCVLYELMTGTPPFVASAESKEKDRAGDDPSNYHLAMEIIHCHLARIPIDPIHKLQSVSADHSNYSQSMRLSVTQSRVLSIFSAIVMKLLAKTAEDRYQSCGGLISDLEHCRSLLVQEQGSLSSQAQSLSEIIEDSDAATNTGSRSNHSLPLSPSPVKLAKDLASRSSSVPIPRKELSQQSSLPSSLSASTAPIITSASLSRSNTANSGTSSNANSGNYTVGLTDVLSQFHVSQKLYGRGAQVKTLLDSFARVALTGTVEAVLVAGYSGIGKTVVVEEIHKPIVKLRGNFIRGKFDLYKRNVSVLLQAFQQLMVQLLTRDDLPQWRAKIQAALGSEAQVLVELIPGLDKVIGPQPAVPELSGVDTERRVNSQFLSFLAVFTRREHPLVLFIDDLQWCDAMSLSLLKLIFQQENAYLLIIGAYRDNEVTPSHPLMRLLGEIQSDENELLRKRPSDYQSRLSILTLQPLQPNDVLELVMDTLNCTAHHANDMCRLLMLKTRGNPFFINQLLKSFYQLKLLCFDYASGQWRYDVQQLAFTELSDDVVDLLAKQIVALSKDAIHVIQTAACVGNTFTLSELAIAANVSQVRAAKAVWEICAQTGFILPTGLPYELYVIAHGGSRLHLKEGYKQFLLDAHLATDIDDSSEELDSVAANGDISELGRGIQLRFMHDKCQTAAYQLIEPSALPATHLQIGRTMLAHTSASAIDTAMMDIVGHLNRGADLITDRNEMRQLIQLDLKAANKAKQNTAYQSAVSCTSVALKTLGRIDECWQWDYDLSMEVQLAHAECCYLFARYDEAIATINEGLANVIRSQSVNPLDSTRFMELEQHIAIAQNRYEDALTVGLQALDKLNFVLPTASEIKERSSNEEQLMKDLDAVVESAPMTDPIDLAIMRLLITNFSPAYFLNKPVFGPVIFGMIIHSMARGRSVMLAFSLSAFTHVLHELQLLSSCYKVGRLAQKLADQYGNAARGYRCKVHSSFSVAVFHWALPMHDGVEFIKRASLMDLEDGDHEYYSYTSCFVLDLQLYAGRVPLDIMLVKQAETLADFQKRKLDVAIKYLNMWRICYAKLCGTMTEDDELFDFGDGKVVTQATILDEMLSLKIDIFLFACYTAELTFAYYSQQYQRACTAGHAALNINWWKRGGLVVVPQCNMYYSLSLLASCFEAKRNVLESSAMVKSSRPQPLTSFEAVLASADLCHTYSESDTTGTGDEKAAFDFDGALATVTALQSSLSSWSSHAPMNYQHKFYLVEAERLHFYLLYHPHSMVDGPRYDLIHPTIRMYEQAIQGARTNGFMHEDALANELAAKFCRAVGLRQESDSYARSAFYGYSCWGCQTKLAQIKREFPRSDAGVTGTSLPVSLSHSNAAVNGSRSVDSSASTQRSLESATSQISTRSSQSTPQVEAKSLAVSEPSATVPSSVSTPVFPTNMYRRLPSTDAPSLDAIDAAAVMKASLAFSVETDLHKLTRSLMLIVIQHAGASRGTLLLHSGEQWKVELTVSSEDSPQSSTQASADSTMKVVQQCDVSIESVLPITVFNYVTSTREACLLDTTALTSNHSNNATTNIFAMDPYFVSHSPKALLMVPILHQSKHVGLLYLENEHTDQAFTVAHVEILQLLAAQAALSIQNARLYTHITDQNSQLQSEIRERLAAEASMKVAKEAAEKATEIKSAFMANVSHEIRTPLNALLGLSQLVQETDLTSEQSHLLQLISNAGSVLLSIIQDMLDFSTVDRQSFELDNKRFSLVDTIEGTSNICWELTQTKGIDFFYRVHRLCPEFVIGDDSRLQQILMHLVSNAAKHTERGSIQINVELGSRGIVSTNSDGESVVELKFDVIDTGEGIDAETMTRLFTPFTQAGKSARRFGGIGLGLTISRRLTEAMGGTITVSSEVGKGSTFTFTALVRCNQPTTALDGNAVVDDETHASMSASSPHHLTVSELASLSSARALLVATLPSSRRHWQSLLLDYGVTVLDAHANLLEAQAGADNRRSTGVGSANVYLVDCLSFADWTHNEYQTDKLDQLIQVAAPTDTRGYRPVVVVIVNRILSMSSRSTSPIHVDEQKESMSDSLHDWTQNPLVSPSSAAPPANIGDSIVNQLASVKLSRNPAASSDSNTLTPRSSPSFLSHSPGAPLAPLALPAYDLHLIRRPARQQTVLQLIAAHQKMRSDISRVDSSLDEESVGARTVSTVGVALTAFHSASVTPSAQSMTPISETNRVARRLPQLQPSARTTASTPPPPPTPTPIQSTMLMRSVEITPRRLTPATNAAASVPSTNRARSLLTLNIAMTHPLSILLAEDNPVNIKMMRLFLSKLGYADVHVCTDGTQVLEYLDNNEKSHGPAVQVLLLDIGMEPMDGIDCTRLIRQRETQCLYSRRLFIIAQTANAYNECRERCLAVGVDRFLAKPITIEALSRQLIEASQLLQPTPSSHESDPAAAVALL